MPTGSKYSYYFKKAATMVYNKVTLSDRKRIYDCYMRNEDWKMMARTLGVNIRTAYHWLKNEQQAPKKKGGSKSVKTNAMIAEIVQWIEQNPSITLKEVRDLIQVKWEITVSIVTVKNWLDGELITVRQVCPIPSTMNS